MPYQQPWIIDRHPNHYSDSKIRDRNCQDDIAISSSNAQNLHYDMNHSNTQQLFQKERGVNEQSLNWQSNRVYESNESMYNDPRRSFYCNNNPWNDEIEPPSNNSRTWQNYQQHQQSNYQGEYDSFSCSQPANVKASSHPLECNASIPWNNGQENTNIYSSAATWDRNHSSQTPGQHQNAFNVGNSWDYNSISQRPRQNQQAPSARNNNSLQNITQYNNLNSTEVDSSGFQSNVTSYPNNHVPYTTDTVTFPPLPPPSSSIYQEKSSNVEGEYLWSSNHIQEPSPSYFGNAPPSLKEPPNCNSSQIWDRRTKEQHTSHTQDNKNQSKSFQSRCLQDDNNFSSRLGRDTFHLLTGRPPSPPSTAVPVPIPVPVPESASTAIHGNVNRHKSFDQTEQYNEHNCDHRNKQNNNENNRNDASQKNESFKIASAMSQLDQLSNRWTGLAIPTTTSRSTKTKNRRERRKQKRERGTLEQQKIAHSILQEVSVCVSKVANNPDDEQQCNANQNEQEQLINEREKKGKESGCSRPIDISRKEVHTQGCHNITVLENELDASTAKTGCNPITLDSYDVRKCQEMEDLKRRNRELENSFEHFGDVSNITFNELLGNESDTMTNKRNACIPYIKDGTDTSKRCEDENTKGDREKFRKEKGKTKDCSDLVSISLRKKLNHDQYNHNKYSDLTYESRISGKRKIVDLTGDDSDNDSTTMKLFVDTDDSIAESRNGTCDKIQIDTLPSQKEHHQEIIQPQETDIDDMDISDEEEIRSPSKEALSIRRKMTDKLIAEEKLKEERELNLILNSVAVANTTIVVPTSTELQIEDDEIDCNQYVHASHLGNEETVNSNTNNCVIRSSSIPSATTTTSNAIAASLLAKKDILTRALRKKTLEMAKAKLRVVQMKKEEALQAKLHQELTLKNQSKNNLRNRTHDSILQGSSPKIYRSKYNSKTIDNSSNLKVRAAPLRDISAVRRKNLLILDISSYQSPNKLSDALQKNHAMECVSDVKKKGIILNDIESCQPGDESFTFAPTAGVDHKQKSIETINFSKVNVQRSTSDDLSQKNEVQKATDNLKLRKLELLKKKLKLKQLKAARTKNVNEVKKRKLISLGKREDEVTNEENVVDKSLVPTSTSSKDSDLFKKTSAMKIFCQDSLSLSEASKVNISQSHNGQLKQNIAACLEKKKDLTIQKEILDLKVLLQKQRNLMTNQGNILQESTKQLHKNSNQIIHEKECLAKSEQRLLELIKRKRRMENMVTKVTTKLICARKKRDDFLNRKKSKCI